MRVRRRFQERPASQERGRAFMIGLGLFGLAIAVVLIVISFNAPNSIPGRGYYTVSAAFGAADNVTGHSQVRIGGKIVGQILNPRVEDGQAVVDLQIDPKYGPLRADSTVEVRPRSAVGVRYVAITPGTKGDMLTDGGRIPASQTSSTLQLDDVFSTLDPPTRERAQVLLRELGTGFVGRGQDLNDSFATFPGFLEGTESVLGAIADRTGAAGNLVRGAGVVAGAADPVRVEIGEGFAPAAKALRPFSDAGDALHSTLEKAPPTLDTLTDRLPEVDALVDELNDFARTVRPVLQAAPPALFETSALLDEARPGLRDVAGTVRTLDAATDPTLDLLRTVRPVLPNVDFTLQGTRPITDDLGRYGCDIIRFGKSWTSMMQYGNKGGGVLRFLIVSPDPSSISGAQSPQPVGQLSNGYPEPCTAGNELTGGTR
jgi:virulence factor Mce-like protein